MAEAIRDGLNLSISLAPIPPTGLVGYRARRYAGVVDVDAIGAYEVNQFWEVEHEAAVAAAYTRVVKRPAGSCKI